MFVMHWVWKCEFAPNHDLDVMQTYNKNACKVQNMGGLGNWKFEVKVEKMNETFWFNKTQIQSLIEICNSFNCFFVQMKHGFHIWRY
jgi:hypothetical protein